MKERFSARFLLPALLLLAGANAPGAEAGQEAIAQGEALLWLRLVDTNQLDQSWEEMSPSFKSEVSKRKWKATITEIRKPLGKVLSRKPKSAEYTKELPGAPEGEYVVVQFETAFEKRPAATEKLTLMLGSDLTWRVSSYRVK